MNTKKQNSGSNAKFYVVLPTLEIMLSASKNCKLRAGYANMEYSNFMKHCKMQTDLRINTYARCAAAFDMDVLLIHLPKGMIESMIATTPHKSLRFSTMEQEDLIVILNRLCKLDSRRFSSILCSYCTNWGRTLNFQTDDNPRRATIQS